MRLAGTIVDILYRRVSDGRWNNCLSHLTNSYVSVEINQGELQIHNHTHVTIIVVYHVVYL